MAKKKLVKKARTNTLMDSELVQMGRIISAAFGEELVSVLSEAARPIIQRRYREALKMLNSKQAPE